MKFARNAGIQALVVVAALVACSQVRAGYVALPSDLGTLSLAGNYTTVGNYTFTFGGYSSTTVGGTTIPAGSVGVTAVTGPITGFQLTSPFAATGVSQNDIAFDYTVSTTGPAMTSVSLNANGFTSGTGLVQIIETVYTDASETTLLGQIGITTGTGTLNLGGSYSSLFVTRDIIYNTYAPGDTASVSIINQTFAVPEPGSWALLGSGLAGIWVFIGRRRRRFFVW